MKHLHYTEVKEEIPDIEGVKDTTIRWLISKKDGAKNFAMRLFTVQPGGHSPYHQHEFEHEVFIVNGNGELREKSKSTPFKKGDFIFVPSMEWHQFANTSDKEMQFLCLVPIQE